MSYTPTNVAIFCAAFAGALSAMAASTLTPTNPAIDETGTANLAFAFAESFDTAWASPAATSFEIDAASTICEQSWTVRGLPPQRDAFGNPIVYLPTSFTTWTVTLVDIVRVGTAALTAAGIIPPAPGGGAVVSRSVQTYGAVGDGVHDDTIAIQTCINVGPGLIVFPPLANGAPALYKISSLLTCTHDNTTFVGYSRTVTSVLQTGVTVVAGRVLGAYDMFQIPPSAVIGVVSRNITFLNLGFVGQNNPFFQTIPADQGAFAAVHCVEDASHHSADVTIMQCGFYNLYNNIVRTDGGGARVNYLNNTAQNTGGELNINADYSLVHANSHLQVWGVECGGMCIAITDNVLNVSGQTAVSIGGSNGRESYTRSDIGSVVTGATATTPIVITAPPGQNPLVAGMSIQITGVNGVPAANIKGFVGTVHSPSTFDLLDGSGNPTVGVGAYINGGAINFNGNFGCVVSGNTIDTTQAGGGIIVGEGLVGCVVSDNAVRRTAPGEHCIQVATSVAFFADYARKTKIDNNFVSSSGGHGIFVETGDGHTITNNTVTIDLTPAPNPVYGTGVGILVANATGDMRDVIIANNQAAGQAGDFVIDSIQNADFHGNSGTLRFDAAYAGYGPASFTRYEESIGGITSIAGAVVFPPVVISGAVTGSATQPVPFAFGSTSVAFAGDANQALTPAQYCNPFIDLTGPIAGPLGAQRDVTLPLRTGAILVVNNSTTGVQNIRVIDVAHTGVGAIVPNGKTAIVVCRATGWQLGAAAV